MEKLLNIMKSLLEPTGVLIIVIILLVFTSWIFNRMKTVKNTAGIIKRSITFLIAFIGTIIFILALPIDPSAKGQILSLLSIIISAAIALSSTTILGNLIAGFMNNSMNRFGNGDLISINDLQGRVVRRSAFHIEIQLEDSNFVTLPNLYVATHPVKLTRKTNTVISSSVSLGYDVSRSIIEEALKEAALATGLNDPYVYITDLGDFSVTYKVHGFLEDTGKFFTTRSLLNAKVMDLLHKNKIEIVSPTFMNQRRVDEQQFIPEYHAEKKDVEEEVSPEELVFDEAIKSEEEEKKKELLNKMIARKDELKAKIKETKDKEEIEKYKNTIERLKGYIEKMEENIAEEHKKKKEE
ncbi:MAG: mechanosensitive ion channel domain-containing protein [Bacteroidales bacterium]|jgi:small-conductance mechanosensitive channel|nr:mechanosensitive ion channel domain-containing protein [Bacteroidales bacterium]